MLLTRIENNGLIKAMYSSSTICGSTFETKTNDLTVIFNNGGRYKYPNIELSDYTRLETSDSSGSVFNTYIKKKYTNFEKLENLPADKLKQLLDQIETLKVAEDKASTDGKAKVLVLAMNQLIGEYLATGDFNKTTLDRLTVKLGEYSGTTKD
jgi:hypothetical protein